MGVGRDPIDDDATLVAIAHLMLTDLTLKPTTAIFRVVHDIERGPLRRLQSKWRISGWRYLIRVRSQLRLGASDVMGTSKISSQGQVFLPVAIRHALALDPGDYVVFSVADGVVTLRATKRTTADATPQA